MTKVLFITGGTSPIGSAIIKKFAQSGYDIFFTYNFRVNEALEIVSYIQSLGVKCVSFKIDMTSSDAIKDIIAEFKKYYSKPDVVVNNAAIVQARCTINEIDDLDIDKQIMVGLNSLIKITKYFSSFMSKNSSIINISSEAGKFGGNKLSLYASIKGAVNSFTIGVARELGEKGIRINAISPAVIGKSNVIEEDSTIPLGRKGTPSDIANIAYFLSTEDASYLSGSILTVSGAR